MIQIWHNPRCSKSRAALKLLQEAGVTPNIRRYLDDSPGLDELAALHRALGSPPVIEMMRPGEARFRDLGLSRQDSDAALLQAMVDAPILIERPVVLNGDRAVIARPPERALDIL